MVTVNYRKKNKMEKPSVYSAEPLSEENIAVQRWSLLVAIDDDFNLVVHVFRDQRYSRSRHPGAGLKCSRSREFFIS